MRNCTKVSETVLPPKMKFAADALSVPSELGFHEHLQAVAHLAQGCGVSRANDVPMGDPSWCCLPCVSPKASRVSKVTLDVGGHRYTSKRSTLTTGLAANSALVDLLILGDLKVLKLWLGTNVPAWLRSHQMPS
eukprot:Skav228195  [mRNA]  locus=scaffold704:100948:101496:- [translate_table: standard]